ncbi:MAG: hypothetical protein ABI977_18855 [Acidobacteriota bacterium]
MFANSFPYAFQPVALPRADDPITFTTDSLTGGSIAMLSVRIG